jgi:hypothetical protein
MVMGGDILHTSTDAMIMIRADGIYTPPRKQLGPRHVLVKLDFGIPFWAVHFLPLPSRHYSALIVSERLQLLVYLV